MLLILNVTLDKDLALFWLQMVLIAAKNATAVDLTLTLILNVETLEFLLEPFLYILCLLAIFLV